MWTDNSFEEAHSISLLWSLLPYNKDLNFTIAITYQYSLYII